MDGYTLLRKAEEIVNRSTVHTVGDSEGTADWVMSLLDEEGYSAASMLTVARADGFKWIAFCTGLGGDRPNRAKKDSRASVCLFYSRIFRVVHWWGK